MQSALEQLNRTPGVLGSIVVAEDGLVIARHVAHGIDADAVAATVCALAHSVGALCARCGRGSLRSTTLESDGHRLFVVRLAVGTLVAIAEGSASVGLTRMAMKQAVAAVEEHLPGAQRHRADEATVHASSA
jgi:hypothetical protein